MPYTTAPDDALTLGLPESPRTPSAPVVQVADLDAFAARAQQELARCRRRLHPMAVLCVTLGGAGARAPVGPAPAAPGAEPPDPMALAGQRLRAMVRGSDEVVQIGTRRFGVVLREVGAPMAAQIRHRLLRHLAEPYAVGIHRFELRAQVGHATYPLDGETADELVSLASCRG